MNLDKFLFFITVFMPVTLLAQEKPSFNPAEPFSKYSKQMDAYYDRVGKKLSGYKQWKRMQWYQESRLGPDGKVPDAERLKQQAINQVSFRAQQLRTTQNDLYQASWNFTGPNEVTSTDKGIGRVNRIVFHPTDVNTFFVCAAGGGLWKTTNAGTSWISLTDGLPNINTSGMALNYNNTNTMYLLTGDGDAAFSGAYGCCEFALRSIGVIKTTDGGNSWRRTGLQFSETQGYAGYNIKMHPTNPDILFVTTNGGVFRTINAGATWTEVMDSLCFDIEFKPDEPSVVYVSGRQRVYRSADGGNNWSVVYDFSGNADDRVELAVTSSDPQYVYAVAGPAGPASFRGLIRSVDGGNNFTLMTTTPNILGRHPLGIDSDDQSSYDLTITVNPSNKNHIIVGGIYLWQSTNGGTTFSQVSPSNNYHADIHDVRYHPLASHLQYHCSDGGVYRYNNLTGVWANLNTGLQVTQYYKISTAQTNTHQVTGGTQDNGTHMMNLNNPIFNRVNGGDGMDNIISPSNASFIYASIQNSTIYKSTNNGSSFFALLDEDDHINYNLNTRWVTQLALHPSDNNTIFIGTFPMVKVLEVGGARLITVLNNTGRGGRALTVAPSDANRLYCSNTWSFSGDQEGCKAWRSTDGGTTWTEVYSNTSNGVITGIAVNPDNASEIFACFGGYESGYKIIKSTDGGDNWTNITGTLPNVPVNCIIYDDTNGNPDDALYIGTDIGVFYRDNNLGDWIPFSNGLPVVEITDLEIQKSSGVLRAGTYGRGIWQTALFTTICNATFTFGTNSHNSGTPYFYQASTSITSTAQIAGLGTNIQYRAGARVILNPGFVVNAVTDAKFSATIGSCVSGGVPGGYLLTTYNGLKGYLVE
jgi:photosystem II stability/assembly factor-like uncharacterized protein